MRNSYTYKAKLLRAVSGDTAWLELDLGLRAFKVERVKLTGIRAPRAQGDTMLAGDAARAALEALCRVEIYACTMPEKTYGRWTVTLYDGDGANINDKLVMQGHAQYL